MGSLPAKTANPEGLESFKSPKDSNFSLEMERKEEPNNQKSFTKKKCREENRTEVKAENKTFPLSNKGKASSSFFIGNEENKERGKMG